MNSIIITTTLTMVWRLMALASLYYLLRGHNEPGGGFIAGLLLALSLILKSHIENSPASRSWESYRAGSMIAWTLIAVLAIILLPAAIGDTIFTGIWTAVYVPIAGKLSSVLLFDIGVYIIVSIATVYMYAAFADVKGRSGTP